MGRTATSGHREKAGLDSTKQRPLSLRNMSGPVFSSRIATRIAAYRHHRFLISLGYVRPCSTFGAGPLDARPSPISAIAACNPIMLKPRAGRGLHPRAQPSEEIDVVASKTRIAGKVTGNDRHSWERRGARA